jgi:hypothetical protein
MGRFGKKSKLEKVLKVKPFIHKDENGRYLNMCAYSWHEGIIKERQLDICIERGCHHYYKTYLK